MNEPRDADGQPIIDVERGEKACLRGKLDWRTIAELHEKLDGTGLAPETETHLKTMMWWKKMNVWDRDDFEKAMRFTAADGKNVRWIASIPPAIWAAMLETEPDILKDPKAFKRWLLNNSPTGGGKYRVPGAKL